MNLDVIREVPAPDPLSGISASASHPDLSDEPVLNSGNIQGNSLAGFNKDFQAFLFLRITDGSAFKASLEVLANSISTLAEVVAFNRLFKELKTRSHKEP